MLAEPPCPKSRVWLKRRVRGGRNGERAEVGPFTQVAVRASVIVRAPGFGVVHRVLRSALYFGSIALVQSSWSWKRSRAEVGTQIRNCPGHRGERSWWHGQGLRHPEGGWSYQVPTPGLRGLVSSEGLSVQYNSGHAVAIWRANV